jgi:LPS sulfotransferase NodH
VPFECAEVNSLLLDRVVFSNAGLIRTIVPSFGVFVCSERCSQTTDCVWVSMNLFFILGCPRSGTTLLQAMLNRHPHIAIPPETKLFCNFHSRSQRRRQECLQRLKNDLDVPMEEDDIHTQVNELLPKVMTRFVERSGRTDVRFVGEKTPEHTSRIPSIRACFPESLIIAMVRDGVGVADSLTRVPWLSCDHGSAALVWRYYMNHVLAAIEMDAQSIHVVRYEELTANPEGELQKILQKLGADTSFVGEMLRSNTNLDGQLFPRRESEWKANAVQPISPRDRSVLSLTVYQAKAIEAACGQMLRRWRYPSAANDIGLFENFQFKFLNHIKSLHTIAKMPADKWTDELKRLVISSLQFRQLKVIPFRESNEEGVVDCCDGRTR